MASKLRKIGTLTSGRDALVDYRIVNATKLAFAIIKTTTGFNLYSRIIQAKGGAILSAGTHTDGFALDIRVWGMSDKVLDVIVAIFRECGFSASWYRDWTGNAHLHCGADLGDTYTRVRYQCYAARGGYNGLGRGGWGGPDTHKAPTAWRCADTTGPTWAQTQLQGVGLPGTGAEGPDIKPPIPPIKEDTLSAAEVNEIKAYVSSRIADLNVAAQARAASTDARVEAVTGAVNAHTNSRITELHAATREDRETNNVRIAELTARAVWLTNVNRGTPEDPLWVSTLQELADAKSYARDSLALDLANKEARKQAAHGPVDYEKVQAVVAAELAKLTIVSGGTK